MPLSRSIKSLVLGFDLRRRVTPADAVPAACDDDDDAAGARSVDGELTIPTVKSRLSDDLGIICV